MKTPVMLETSTASARSDAAVAPRSENRRRSSAGANTRAATLPGRVSALRAPTLSWSAAGRKTSGGAASAVGRVGRRHGAARTWRDVELEQPLVVTRGAAVGADRGLLALAANSRDAARHLAGRLRRRVAPAWGRSKAAACARRSPARLVGACSRYTRLLRAELQRQELAVFRHRVLVFLAQEPVLDQKVEARGQCVRQVGVLEPEEGNRARVLLAAEDELGLFFPLRLVTPDWHRDRQQNGHDGERDEQRRHGISALRVVTLQSA